MKKAKHKKGKWLLSDGRSSHFALYETKCWHCKKNRMTQRQIDHMEILRNMLKMKEGLGKAIPLRITKKGGYRCTVGNKLAGGASRSQHLKGNGCDISIRNWKSALTGKRMSVAEIIKLCQEAGFDGIGVKKSALFVHADCRGKYARWGYKKS